MTGEAMTWNAPQKITIHRVLSAEVTAKVTPSQVLTTPVVAAIQITGADWR
jgi:hypothetical protein